MLIDHGTKKVVENSGHYKLMYLSSSHVTLIKTKISVRLVEKKYKPKSGFIMEYLA